MGAAAQTGGGAAGAWLLLAGLAVGALFLWRQRGLAAPLFPVDLLRIPVFALSMGSSVGAFCAQMMGFLALPFLLLQDEDMKIINAYGVWGPKVLYGRKYDGIHRLTFVIDEKGKIEKIVRKVLSKKATEQALK